MQMAPWLLPAMRRRYRGADTPVDELRVFDAREVPAPLAAMHGTQDAQIGEARCTWIAPERRQAGVVVFLHGGAYVFGPGPGHWDWLCALCELTGTAGLLVRGRHWVLGIDPGGCLSGWVGSWVSGWIGERSSQVSGNVSE